MKFYGLLTATNVLSFFELCKKYENRILSLK